MLAAKAGHLNVVKKLITSGAMLDITDKVNSLSTTNIHCTYLQAQHMTLLCSLSPKCCLYGYCQLIFPMLDLRFAKQLKTTINLLINLATDTNATMYRIHETFLISLSYSQLSKYIALSHWDLCHITQCHGYVTKPSIHCMNVAMSAQLNTQSSDCDLSPSMV